ncbi:MAG: heme NO-binding domain-containing protein [Roseicyclus sp.]
MHGMINRALQSFVVSTYGPAIWEEILDRAGAPAGGFEAMVQYPHALTLACMEATVEVLEKEANALLEDIGTYLVTDPRLEPLRRLLRFGGASFAEFLFSLDEMPERARLALPDLQLPEIALRPEGGGSYMVAVRWALPGAAPLLMGALRAMADDYGALVTMELAGHGDGEERLRVTVFDADFTAGRAFSLGQSVP